MRNLHGKNNCNTGVLEVAGYATQHIDPDAARRVTLAGGDIALRAGSANERPAGSCMLLFAGIIRTVS